MAIIPQSNVSFNAVVAATLGVSNTTASALCTSAKINGDAKYKPTRFSCDFDNNRDTLINGYHQWQGEDGNCGWSIPAFTSYLQVCNSTYCSGGLNGWQLLLPVNRYRIGDFRFYEHSATRFLDGIKIVGATQYNDVSETGATVYLNCRTVSTDYMLALTDIVKVKNCYFGVRIVHSSGNYARTFVTTSTIASGGDAVTIIPKNLNTGNWSVYAFFSTVSNPELAGDFYPVRYAAVQTLKIKDKTERITITVTVSFVGLQANWTLKITNNTSEAITLNNNSIQFRKPGATTTTGMTIEEESQSLTIGSLAAGATKTFSGTSYRASDLKQSYGSCDVYVTLGGATYTQWSRGWS